MTRHALIVGAGIGGLAAALTLHRAGWTVTLAETTERIRPLGVGINLLPHGAAVLEGLGLAPDLRATGVRPAAFEFRTRYGHVLQRDPRGQEAGFAAPQYSIHRGRLQLLLKRAVEERLGDVILSGHRLVQIEQHADCATGVFARRDGTLARISGDVLIGADGIHSTVRRRLHPGEGAPNYEGLMMYRGATLWPAFGDGRTAVVAGNHDVKFVVYPIAEEAGGQLMNWVAEVRRSSPGPLDEADWTREAGRGFIEHYRDWRQPDLDVVALMQATETVLEYPMIDRDPLRWWTRGRVTLLGDAAHPMYPVGANGASQAVIDAEVLARELSRAPGPEGLAAYEAERREKTAQVVLSNRKAGPEAVLDLADARLRGPDDRVEDLIRPEEAEAVAANYRKLAGFARMGEA